MANAPQTSISPGTIWAIIITVISLAVALYGCFHGIAPDLGGPPPVNP